MIELWIKYRIIVRKCYETRIGDWNDSASGLAFMLVFLNIISLIFYSEYFFDIKGFRNLAENRSIPLAPIGGAVAVILYILGLVFFKLEYNAKNIALIKKCFLQLNWATEKTSHIVIAIPVMSFLIGLILLIYF